MLIRVLQLVAMAAVAGILAWVLFGGNDGDRPSTTVDVGGVPLRKPPQPKPTPAAEPPRGLAGKEVEAAVRSYVAAIDARSGARLCPLLAPGALSGVRIAHPGSACTDSLGASIGTPARHGAPSWTHTRVDHFDTIAIADGRARATLEVIHRFTGRDQPSTEDDIVYLRRQDGSWIVVQPSATLYRALGYGEPPLAAISPP